MIHIRRQADLDKLREAAVSQALVTAVEAHFAELREVFDASQFEREFVLDSGHIVVIEPTRSDGENALRYLSSGWAEWGEIDHSFDPPVLKIVVMFDNDDLHTVFTQIGGHPAMDNWIKPYLES